MNDIEGALTEDEIKILEVLGRLDIPDDLIMSEMGIKTGVYIRILREIEMIGR